MASVSAHPDVIEKLVSLAKRRGFIFQSSEIYGGTGSVWDYGPLGVELKKNVKDRWWNAMVRARDDIEGLDAAILMHPRVWEASGHVAGFSDPLVDCRNCKRRFRADDPSIKGTPEAALADRKSTRLNSSHMSISYAVFCLKKKKKQKQDIHLRNQLAHEQNVHEHAA